MRWLLLAAISFVSGQVQCPDGYTSPNTYTGYCYKYTPDTLTWNGHEVACSRVTLNGKPYAGGHLATIFDQPSATAVMDLYCNGLSQQFGQSHYFVGYYCISSSYTYRPDWRWSSGLPTTWLHAAPAYLSGAEPDDAGCGRAHYSDDGANTGRIGDWSCGSPLAGGCCEAPVVPTPSPTMTASNTATATNTQTATRTQTATNTQTGTQTPTNTQTGTRTQTSTETRTTSKTATETRTATATATTTSTATSSATPSPTMSTSTSPSFSVSPSSSSSPSASSSISSSATITTTPSISTSITPTPRPISVLSIGESGVAAAGQESLGVGAGPDTSAQEAATQQKFVVSVAAGAGAAALIFALCCGWLLCALRKRRQIREKKARAALASKQQTIQNKPKNTTVAATLGMKTPAKPNALFRSMNPALLTGPITRETRGPRLSMALSAYKSPTSFRPQPVVNQHRQSTVAESLLENPESDEVEDAVIGIEEQLEKTEETGVAKEYEEQTEEKMEEIENESEKDEDYIDDDEDIATALAKKTAGKHVDLERTIQQRTKKTVEAASAPPVESKKLVIGKGAILQEHVQRQTVQLRRVSKVRGDQQLTALRQQRPSTVARAGYAPQSSSRNLLNPYEFTATVSRVIMKAPTDEHNTL